MAGESDLFDIVNGASYTRYLTLSQEERLDVLFDLNDDLSTGIALGGPSVADVDPEAGVPLLLLTRLTGTRTWEVSVRDNTRLVGVNLADGSAIVAHAFPSGRRRDAANRPKSRAGAPPEAENAASISTDIHELDARRLLDLPATSGTWAFSVMCHDLVTRPAVVVELRGGEMGPATGSAGAPLELAWSLAAQARAADAAPGTLPRYSPGDETPALDGEGAALAGPSDVSSPTAPFVLHGVVRMPLPPRAIVSGGSPDAAAAVLRATIVVARLDEATPTRVAVDIPVLAGADLQPGQVVEGWFSLDLTPLLPSPLEPGQILSYLVAGAHVAGPVFTTISPAQNP